MNTSLSIKETHNLYVGIAIVSKYATYTVCVAKESTLKMYFIGKSILTHIVYVTTRNRECSYLF